MPRFVIRCAALIAGLFASDLAAQEVAPRADSLRGCDYETCALRVEPAAFGRSLVRGVEAERISRLGLFGSGVGPLLVGPDSSAHYARRYVRSTRWAESLGVIAGVGLAVASLRDGGLRDGLTDPLAQVAATGSVVTLWASIPFTLRAQRSFSRAVWWYNAALPR